MKATFVMIDIIGKHPLFGRECLQQLGIDLTALLNQSTIQMHQIDPWSSEPNGFLIKYADIFKRELDLL